MNNLVTKNLSDNTPREDHDQQKTTTADGDDQKD